MVEGAALEMLCTKVPRVRIPNSPPNVHGNSDRIIVGFFHAQNRLKSRLFLFQSINEPRCRAFMQRGFLLFPVLTTYDAVVIVKLMGIH